MKQRHIRYDPMPCQTILNPVKASSMPFTWSINPFRGCQHGCSFCYARSTHAFLGQPADDTFQNQIFIKVNAAEKLREQLHRKSRTAGGLKNLGTIALGTATDPYQQIEASACITRQCLEVIAEFQVPITVTTRSPLILRDVGLLKKIPVVSVNISINTMNSSIWRKFEPSTPSPIKRMRLVKQLNDEGIPAGIFLAPVLPRITDHSQQLTELISLAADNKAAFVMFSFLRLSTSAVKTWFFHALREHYPHLTSEYGRFYNHSSQPPSSYKSEVSERILSLLTQHSLINKEPIRSKSVSLSSQDQSPVQLAFPF